eukprot:SAG25_NODE_14_length_24446_cov_22.033678_12_plen_200_part_00
MIEDAWLPRLAPCRAILALEFAISLMILDRSMMSVAMNLGKIVVSSSRTVVFVSYIVWGGVGYCSILPRIHHVCAGSGVPLSCNLGCAHVVVSFFDVCSPQLGHNADQYAGIVTKCRATVRATFALDIVAHKKSTYNWRALCSYEQIRACTANPCHNNATCIAPDHGNGHRRTQVTTTYMYTVHSPKNYVDNYGPNIMW